MKFWKKLMAINILIIILGSFIGCSKKEGKIPYSFEVVLKSYSSETTIDEVLEQDITIEIIENQTVTKQDLIDNIKKLEQNLEFVEETEVLGIRDKELIQKQKNSQNWINDNGLRISEKLLSLSIKAIACDAYGISGKFYKNCTIMPSSNLEDNEKTGIIEVVDPTLSIANTFFISENSEKALPLALQTFYFLKESTDHLDTATINEVCKKAIDTSKNLIASTTFIEDGEIKTKSTFTKSKSMILNNNSN